MIISSRLDWLVLLEENAGVSGFLFFLLLLAFICGQTIEGTYILFLSVTLLNWSKKVRILHLFRP